MISKASVDSFDSSSTFSSVELSPKDPANQDSLLSAGAVITSSGTPINLVNDVMMIGLVFQVTLGVFGALAADVYFGSANTAAN